METIAQTISTIAQLENVNLAKLFPNGCLSNRCYLILVETDTMYKFQSKTRKIIPSPAVAVTKIPH
jgi:hypothetical protein